MMVNTIIVPRVIHTCPEKTVLQMQSDFQYSFLMDEYCMVKTASRSSVLHFFGEILNSFIMDSHMKADLNCPRIHLVFF